MEMCSVFTFHCPLSVWGNIKHLIIQTKWGNGCGFTNWLSLQCGDYSRDLWDEKSPVSQEAGCGGRRDYKGLAGA